MPTHKLRGIVREYLQALILKYLYQSRWQDRFFFLSGTCLRLLYGLKRFSEDVDFNIKNLTQSEFEETAKFIKKELDRSLFRQAVGHKEFEAIFYPQIKWRFSISIKWSLTYAKEDLS